MFKAVIALMILFAAYTGFEAYSIFAETGKPPPPGLVVKSMWSKVQPVKSLFDGQSEQRTGTTEYSVSQYTIRDDSFSFSFGLEIEATERFQRLSPEEFSSSLHPNLEVPSDCKLGSLGTATGGGSKKRWTYEVICGGALYARLESYAETVKAKVERERANLPFTVLDMSISYETILGMPVGANGLGMNVKPNRRTEVDEPYRITVYDEDGDSRGGIVVSWTRPELNVKAEKFLGP